jgi:pimeloyl-ACP methyl ester carboxylesterase
MSARAVSVDSGGCALAGTYDEAVNPVAAALLIGGSGKTDRDSDVHLPLHQMLRGGITRQISDALVAARVSALRYDKRGVAASGGDYLSVGMAQRLADARAASTGAEVLSWQTQRTAARLPRSARVILRLMRTDAIRAQRKNMDRILASSDDVMRIQGSKVNARWVRDFAAYDPGPVLARITVPVLAITGGEDVQVPPADVHAMGQLVPGPFEGHVVGDLSHMLRPDPGSIGPRGYRRATRQPVSPEVLGLITGWVARHWSAQARPGGERTAADSGN